MEDYIATGAASSNTALIESAFIQGMNHSRLYTYQIQANGGTDLMRHVGLYLALLFSLAGSSVPCQSGAQEKAKIDEKIEQQTTQAGIAAPVESPEAFLDRYFATLANATSLKELKPFYVVDKDDDKELEGMSAALEQLALAFIKQEPSKIKIIKKTEQPGRVTFELAPAVIPQDFIAQSKEPDFSMTGSVILVQSDGQWKVHKDYWTVQSKGQHGKTTTSFGHNPDKDDGREKADNKDFPTGPKDYESEFRDKLMDSWKPRNSGTVQAIMKVEPDGTLSQIELRDKHGRKQAEEQIHQLLQSKQPFQKLPVKLQSTPYVWMTFDWQDGARGVSGPYFSTLRHDWFLEEAGTKR